MRDKLFNSSSDISDFRFDESVVAVFDDMVKRSVPGYEAMIQMVGQLELTVKITPTITIQGLLLEL